MPPKKAGKKDDKPVEEDDGATPANDVQFKLTFDAKHEGGHYLKLKFNWINVGPPATEEAPVQQIDNEEIDTGYLKEWTLVQIEGEEAVEQVAEVDTKAAKGKAPPAKAAGKAGALEEITDNRPREIKFEKSWTTEEGNSMRISEDVGRYFENFVMSVGVWNVDRETQEETLMEKLELDMSPLLFETQKDKEVTWKFDKMKTMSLLYLNITIGTDVPLLNSFLRAKLNPLQVNLVACKDVPYKVEPQYKPVFAIFTFVDGRNFKTIEMPQQAACKFNHKHVFLLGHLDHVSLKEMLATTIVAVELHDCDEYIEDPKDAEVAKFSAGRAKFTFRDFLRKNVLELKLRSDVFPLKRDEVDNTNNLDLNTTARKSENTVERGSPYLVHATSSIIIANLARPIGFFNTDLELLEFKRKQRELKRLEEGAEGETPVEEASPDVEEVKDSSFVTPEAVWNENDAIFERMIIIIPYKAADMVKKIESTYEKVNCQGLDLPNPRYLSTKELSEEERQNRKIDFMGGFCLMDSETRMYIFEGLGGEGRGIHQFYVENMRSRPNDRKYTLLYNPDVRFKNRIYLDFNVAIKKIKLRENLRAIMGAPDVYLRSKVPEDMFDILQKFAEIRKLSRLSLIRDFNLFPDTEKLLTLERKYGDSLNMEDLTGKPGKPKKKRAGEETVSQATKTEETKTAFQAGTEGGATQQTVGQTTIAGMNATKTTSPGKTGAIRVLEDGETSPQKAIPVKRKADTECKNNDFELHMKERTATGPDDFQRKNRDRIASLNTGRPLKERLTIPEGVDVFQYGNQKLNIWEFQKEQLRQQVAKDTSKFYTYSAEHLSLSFPIVNENEIVVKEKEENEARWKTKSGFDNVMKRQNWNEHPKRPPQSVIENLKIPQHHQALETKMLMKGFEFIPGANGKPDFQSKVKSQKPTFSNKEYFNTVFISGDDMMKEMAQDKQKLIDDFNKKVVVANQHFSVNTMEKRKVAQLDRFKNIREDPPAKVGLRHNNKRLSSLVERQIFATKGVSDHPVCIMKEEDYLYRDHRPPYKVFDKSRSFSTKNMDTNIHSHFLEKFGDKTQRNPKSKKVFIASYDDNDKVGPRW